MVTHSDALKQGNTNLARDESMLKIQASILERYLRKEVQDKLTLEERCRLLRQKIESMDDELLRAGKGSAARRCLEDSSRSEFDAVDHNEFLAWLASTSRSASNTPLQEFAELASPKKRGYESTSSSASFNVFSVALSKDERGDSSRTKRVRYTSKEAPPCLRCRILKKKCDAQEPCSHCPSQSFETVGDFWKVLGCFRGHLKDMADFFCPDFSRATSRKLKNPVGDIEVINFVLTKSRVSEQKRGRIKNLIHSMEDFKSLSGPTWEDVSARETISRSAVSLDQYHGDIALIDPQDYEAAWAVLQLLVVDRSYLSKTAYNLFSLIRLGNNYAKGDQDHWGIFTQAKRILRQSVELYLLERLCSSIATGSMIGQIAFDTTKETPNTLVLVDWKDDMESFLQTFEKLCAGRAKLTWSQQLPVFFALLIFGIAKSIMIDGYVHRSYEDSTPWTVYHALKISSAYKALVSVFCWSSSSDIILQADEEDSAASGIVDEVRELVQFRTWGPLGFSSTKSFLLNLGTCLLPDGSFNGFLAQKMGIDSLSKMKTEVGGAKNFNSDRDNDAPAATKGMLKLTQPIGVYHLELNHLHDTAGINSAARRKLSEANAASEAQSGVYASIRFVQHGSDEELARRGHGRRTGALNSSALEKAREIRKLGACWNCWVMKVPCSEGLQCERCHRIAPRGSICRRGPFSNIFMNILFPNILLNRYLTASVQGDLTTSWIGESIDAQITWGYGPQITMRVSVSKYIPRNAQNRFHDQLLTLGAWPLRLALRDESLVLVAESWPKQLEALTIGPCFPSYDPMYQSSDLVRLVLQIIQKYYKQNQGNELLRSCLLLYLSLYFSRQPIVFPSTSTQSVEVSQLMTVDAQVFTSALLNHQAKCIFYGQAKLHANNILTGLEKLLRSRNRSTWPICFATILMLCICMERLQIHSLAAATIAEPSGGEPNPDDEPHNSCQMIEEIGYGQLSHIFKTLFRSHKGEQGRFNPFFAPYSEDNEASFDDSSKVMIRELREKLFAGDCILLVEHNRSLKTELAPELFGTDNPGRLVARFLTSFVPLPGKMAVLT